MISTSETTPEAPAGRPQPCRTSESGSESRAPPTEADRKPASVTPIWTAERNRFGSPASRATICPRLPRPASCRTCDSRSDTRAISAAANTPPMTMKSRISNAVLTVESIGFPSGEGLVCSAV